MAKVEMFMNWSSALMFWKSISTSVVVTLDYPWALNYFPAPQGFQSESWR